MKKKSKILMLALSAILLAGCQMGDKTSEFKGDDSRIYVTREHNVSSAVVYTSDVANELYNQDELKAAAEAEIAAYNEAKGAGSGTQNTDGAKLPVSLRSCTLEGQTGKVSYDFGSAEDFVAFAGQYGNDTHTVTSLTTNSVAEALASGTLMDGSFVKPDKSAVATDEITRQSELSVVAIEGSATVQTEGPILYVTDQIELIDTFTAKVPEGTHYIIFK